MVVGIKDIFKMAGIIIISTCAVFVCTLFLNHNMDLKEIENLIHSDAMRTFYDAQVMTGKVVSALSGCCLLLTSVVMLCFYIRHYIDTHRRELGILKAMGYSNLQIASGFKVFGFSIFAGTALGYAGAHAFMPYFYASYESEILPKTSLHFHPLLLLCLVLLPSLAFALLSVFYGYQKLKAPVLELLKGKSTEKVKALSANTDMPFLNGLRKSTVRQRKSLVFFIGFAAFCYAAMMQMSCSMDELSSVMMSIMILMIGIILAFVTLFLATTTVVKSNLKTFAMMRVFGYSAVECGRAVLSGYRPVAYIGFAIGTLYQYGLLKIMVSIVFKDIEAVPDYHFDVPAFIITLVSFAIIYEIIMYCYTLKIRKISVKEIMLDAE